MRLKTIGYENTLKELKNVLTNGRSKKGHNIGIEFKAVVKKLNDDYGKEISTKFLRALFSAITPQRKRTFRITYLLRKSGLKTERIVRGFSGWVFQKWNTDIIEYQRTKKAYKKDNCVLTEKEEEQLRVIALIKKNNNIDLPLYPYEYRRISQQKKKSDKNNEPSFIERQNLRNALNKEGGVYIKNIREQDISKCFISNTEKEVIFNIVGY